MLIVMPELNVTLTLENCKKVPLFRSTSSSKRRGSSVKGKQHDCFLLSSNHGSALCGGTFESSYDQQVLATVIGMTPLYGAEASNLPISRGRCGPRLGEGTTRCRT